MSTRIRYPLSLALAAIGFLSAVSLSSAADVVMLTGAGGTPVMYPSYITEYDGHLYFRGSDYPGGTNTELWRSDGHSYERVADIAAGNNGSSPADLAVYGDKLYFSASVGGTKLWQYDPLGGALLAPDSASQAGNPSEMFAYNGALYYRAFRSNIGSELWKFDGTHQTPINMFPDTSYTGSSYPQHFIEYSGSMYFNACGSPGQGTELWRYNGVGMPQEAARIYPNNGSSPEQFAVYDGKLYFSAYDGIHGRELWRYDASNGVAELAADMLGGGAYSSSNPSSLAAFNDKLYFSAYDPVHGYELWRYDGVAASLFAEINFTPNPGNGDDFFMDSSPAELTVFDGLLYFSADDGVHGRELWASDGDDVWLVADINAGPYGSDVSELTVFDGRLYFSADNGYVPSLGTLQPKIFYVAPVPEPATCLLLAATLLCGWIAVRRRADHAKMP